MKYLEFEEQKKVIAWWNQCKAYKVYPEHYLLYNTDTSAKRTLSQQQRYKAGGGLSGLPDLCLAVAVTKDNPNLDEYNRLIQYNALYIEMKSPDRKPKRETSKGGVSDIQCKVHIHLRECGYKVVVCYSANDAIKEIEEYLK